MKTITLSHYTMKDIDPTPWRQTWDNLVHFASRMAPKLAPLGFQLKLRKVELEHGDDSLPGQRHAGDADR